MGRAGVLGGSDFSLTAAQWPRTELQVPVSMRACEHDSHMRAYAHDSLMSHACRPTATTAVTTTPMLLSDVVPRNPLDPLPQGCMGVWDQGTGGVGIDAPNEVQARPQVHADPQQGMLRPTRGPEDVGVNYGQGSGAEGRPDDQRQGRDVYSPGDKTYWELPKLPELGPKQAPLQAGDWLTVITPMINDLAPAANEYWGSVLQAAECVYERWQSASPLLKAQVQANLPDHMRHARYSRLENRALSMLLRRTPGQVASAQEGVTALRKWFRWLQRTQQIGASLPDVSLLVNGLDSLAQHVLMSMPHVMFRLTLQTATTF